MQRRRRKVSFDSPRREDPLLRKDSKFCSWIERLLGILHAGELNLIPDTTTQRDNEGLHQRKMAKKAEISF